MPPHGGRFPGHNLSNPFAHLSQPIHQQPQLQQQQQQQQQQQANGAYGGGFGYNMLGMGLPSMNMLGGFPYNAQMGNFGQVSNL